MRPHGTLGTAACLLCAVGCWVVACEPTGSSGARDGSAGTAGEAGMGGGSAGGAPASAGQSAAGGGPGGAPPCDVIAPTTCPTPPVRYADVQPIIQQRCVTCHNGEVGGPWPLTTYGHVVDWQIEIRGELLSCSMPPLDGGVTLPLDERLTILTWIRCGVPE